MHNFALPGVYVRFGVKNISVRNRCSVPSISSFDPEAVLWVRQGPPIAPFWSCILRTSDRAALGLANFQPSSYLKWETTERYEDETEVEGAKNPGKNISTAKIEC